MSSEMKPHLSTNCNNASQIQSGNGTPIQLLQKRTNDCCRGGEDDIDCQSPVRSGFEVKPKRICFNRRIDYQCKDLTGLSPITEISKNLSVTTLNTLSSLEVGARHSEDRTKYITGKKLSGPEDSLFCCKAISTHNLTNEQKREVNLTTINFDKVKRTDESLSRKMFEKRYQMSHDSGALQHGSRRLNTNGSPNGAMPVDEELSFFDDEQSSFPQECEFSTSPELIGLLSPEGPAQRFQIVEKSVVQKSHASQHKQQKSLNVAPNSESGVGGKSFRIFQSLSSESMESSMEDEYMELFEMESLDQPQNGNAMFNFPSDLNSLIKGQIKHTSPAISNVNALIKTPEMRRPSVRRCLAMSENQQQSPCPPPRTPEFLKQAQDVSRTYNSSISPFSLRLLSKERHTNSSATSPSLAACFKRPDPPSTSNSPVQSKRYRGIAEKENMSTTARLAYSPLPAPHTSLPHHHHHQPLRKCMSMNDAEIMSALARSENKDEPDLIGDFSKPFALPLMDGRHRDLKSISSDTVARLINGDFDEVVESYKIIDCRYPYEFDGGHIKGARNLYTQEQIIDEFLTQQKTEQHQLHTESAGQKRVIIIFHCEFSSERGPKLSRFLRNNDRAKNTNAYPALDYPEIYLLHNGYKEFYETHSELCMPVAYRPMLEPSYSEAYRHFRAKSKSWNGDGGLAGGGTSRLKKTRSRLVL